MCVSGSVTSSSLLSPAPPPPPPPRIDPKRLFFLCMLHRRIRMQVWLLEAVEAATQLVVFWQVEIVGVVTWSNKVSLSFSTDIFAAR